MVDFYCKKIQREIYKYLKCNVLIEQASVFNDVFKIKDEYMKIMNRVNEKRSAVLWFY